MLRNRKLLKTIAVFFLINFLTVIFSDTIAALAAVKEVKSIKGVSQSHGGTIPSSVNDGSVDLKTGDYSYTLPIMEVPGPEGNYPINLVYNAGIQLNQSASLVGLGWSLDAGGSISRTLNGFPDDFCGAQYTVTDTIKTYFNPKTYLNPTTVSAYASQFNLAQQLSTDIMNVSFFDPVNIPFSLLNGQHIPYSPGNDSYTQIGSVVAPTEIPPTPPAVLSGSANLNAYGCLNGYVAQQAFIADPESTTFDCKNLYNPSSLSVTDAPENTTGGCVLQPDYYNISGSGISGAIEPLILDNGSLFRNSYYTPGNNTVNFILPSSTSPPIPFSNQGCYFNLASGYLNSYNYSFRFKNDFSSSFTVNPTTPIYNNSYYDPFVGYNIPQWTYPTSPGYTYTAPPNYLTLDNSNYPNPGNPAALFGSSVINYVTFAQPSPLTYQGNQVLMNYAGFTYWHNNNSVPPEENNGQAFYPSATSNPRYDITNQIRGFVVTNPQGISYHYALPVFTYGSQKYVTATAEIAARSSRTLEIDQPYAYTWLLTTITGPDFIDVNSDGYADEGDQGSWTNFNYGRYSDNYLTRTPYYGKNTETDGAASYAGAYMEVYYLDAVSTRTHTALFQKAARNDNYSANNLPQGGCGTHSVGTLQLQNVLLYTNQQLETLTNTSTIFSAIQSLKSSTGDVSPYVFDNVDLAKLDPNYQGLNGAASNNIQYVNLATDNSLCQGTPDNPTGHGKLTLNQVNFYGANGSYGINGGQLKPPVIFKYELPNQATDNIVEFGESSSNSSNPRSASITTTNYYKFNAGDIISFTMANSNLPTNFINFQSTPIFSSISPSGNITVTIYDHSNPTVYSGLQDANAVNNLFANDVDADDYQSFTISSSTSFTATYYNSGSSGSTTQLNSTTNNYTAYAVIMASAYDGGNTYDIYFLENVPNIPSNTVSILATTTKNPPYVYNFYDNWGYFKSDFLGVTGNENLDREVTATSAAGVDAWSLRTIQTSLGATVNVTYQSDDFSEAKYVQNRIYNICDTISISVNSSNLVSVTFTVRETMNPNDIPQVNSSILIESMIGTNTTQNTSIGFDAYTGSGYFTVTGISANSHGQTVISGYFNSSTTGAVQNNPLVATAGHDVKHYGSYMVIPRQHNYGGGIRTASTSVQESAGGDLFQTNYDYYTYVNNASGSPTTPSTSGVTSYEPATHTALYPLNTATNFPYFGSEYNYWSAYNQFYSDYMGLYSKAFFYGDFIAPQVIYSTVHKREFGNGLQAATYDEYIYQTYDDSLFQRNVVGIQKPGSIVIPCQNSQGYSTNIYGMTGGPPVYAMQDSATTVKLKDYTSCVGNLLSHRTYNLSNKMLSKEDYIYTNAENHPSRQGVLEQVYNIYISFGGEYLFGGNNCPPNPNFHLWSNALTTVKGEYPFYLSKVISNDYLKGRSVTTQNMSFDELSGQVVDVQTKDTYGNVKVGTTIPAYNVYPNMMPLHNMLTQPCGNYSYNTTTSTNFTLSPFSPSSTVINSEVTQYNYTITLNSPLPSGDILDNTINVNETMYPITTITNNNTTVNFSTYTQLPSSGNYIRIKNEVLSAGIQTWTNGVSTYRHYNSTSGNSTSGYYENYTTTDYLFRPYRNYVWNAPYLNSDGSYNNTPNTQGVYSEFNWSNELSNIPQNTNTPQNNYWQKVKENTLYDHYSNLLEAKDINGNYVSTKKDNYHDNKVSATSNSNYCSSFYWNFEDQVPTGVLDTSAEIGWGLVQSLAIGSTVIPHTGSYMASITPSQTWGPTYRAQNLPASRAEGNIITGKTYQASVWVHESSDPSTTLWIYIGGNINCASVPCSSSVSISSNTPKVNNWYLLTTTLQIPSNYASTGGAQQNDVRVYVQNPGTNNLPAYIDDMMFHPVDADLTGYVYDPPTNLLLYKLDGNGYFTQYLYDNNHRLTTINKETQGGVMKVSSYNYYFKNQQ